MPAQQQNRKRERYFRGVKNGKKVGNPPPPPTTFMLWPCLLSRIQQNMDKVGARPSHGYHFQHDLPFEEDDPNQSRQPDRSRTEIFNVKTQSEGINTFF